MTKDIALEERTKLQSEMYTKLEKLIDGLQERGLINIPEHVIARDILWDTTLNHETITQENNIAQYFIDNVDKFITDLHRGYKEMKQDYPDVDGLSREDINEFSANYRDCAYL